MLKTIKTIYHILLVLTVILFLFFELKPSIKIPDINGDEALVACTTLLLKNNIHSDGDFDFFGRHLPLTIYTRIYRGALESYLLLPFVLFKGITLEAIRIGPIFFGILIILMAYWFTSKFFNQKVGIITAILLAFNTSFINIIKLGGAFVFSLPFFSLASLLLFLKFHNTKRNLYFYLGMFFLALGFNAAGFFLWFIISLFLCWLFLYYPRYKIKMTTLCIGFLFLLIGLIPILYCYLRVDLFRRFVLVNLHTTTYGANNFFFYKNLLIRLKHLNEILTGEIWRGGSFLEFPIVFFWASLSFILYRVIIKKTHLPEIRIIFILSLFVFGLISSTFTFTNHWPSHSYLLMPYIQLIIGIAIWEAYKGSNNIIRSLSIILLMALIWFYVGRCVLRYKQLELERQENNSCSIYDLTKWLLENKIFKIAYNDINAQFGIVFLSNLQISNYYFYDSPISPEIIYKVISASPSEHISIIINLLNPENVTVYTYIKSYAQLLGKEIIVQKTFLCKSGVTKFMVCKIK